MGHVTDFIDVGPWPVFNLADLGERKVSPVPRGLWLQIGIAGFAFGNVMMLSFPSYLGLEGQRSPGMRLFFGVVSLALSLPVVTYCASHYWRSAWMCVRQRILTIELPIAVGLVALFAQSAWEILRGVGPGYLDSLCGLVFFLLVIIYRSPIFWALPLLAVFFAESVVRALGYLLAQAGVVNSWMGA